MVIASTLRATGVGCKLLQLPVFRQRSTLLVQQSGKNALAVRNMGSHKRNMQILPSRYEYNHWKDLLHYYVMLAAVPIAGIVAYTNLFIGQAKLSDIPEGYEPKHYEYFKHPISRWFARYCHEDLVRIYEINLHYIWRENEKRKMNLLEQKVKRLMRERQDVKTWYYVPVHSEQQIIAGKEAREIEEAKFGRGL